MEASVLSADKMRMILQERDRKGFVTQAHPGRIPTRSDAVQERITRRSHC